MTTWLTPAEVAELTAAKLHRLQCTRLSQMGIPFRPNFAGRPLVERAAVLRYAGKPVAKKPAEPAWDRIRA